MRSDSTSNADVPGFCKDLGRKKRMNRFAKLKQSKLDVRRQHGLSEVKSKESKVDLEGRGSSPLPSFLVTDEGKKSHESLELKPKEFGSESSSAFERNLESPVSTLVGSSKSSRCYTESSSEGGEDNEDCLDDWEAVADALAAHEKQHELDIESVEFDANPQNDEPESCFKNSGINSFGLEKEQMVYRVQENPRAWHPDDALRPRCLPNPLLHHVPVNSSSKSINWAWRSIMSQPSSCPICFEDLDSTDSSFLPCPCGFHLCLFCHKRILETDGRCPGCRKDYKP